MNRWAGDGGSSRGGLLGRLAGRKVSRSAPSADGDEGEEEAQRGTAQSQDVSQLHPRSNLSVTDVSLERQVEAALSGEVQKCRLAVQVFKEHGSSRLPQRNKKGSKGLFVRGSSKGSVGSGQQNLRILAICDSRLYKIGSLPPAKLKVSRRWNLINLTEIVVPEEEDGATAHAEYEFSLLFDERWFGYSTGSEKLRSQLIWELLQELREQAAAATGNYNNKVQAPPPRSGGPVVPGFHGIGPPIDDPTAEGPLANNPADDVDGPTSFVTNSESESGALGTLSHIDSTSLEKLGGDGGDFETDEPSTGQGAPYEAPSAVTTAEQAKQALEKRKSLQLSQELVDDLVMALDDVVLGASEDGALFSDRLESKIRELETANVQELIHSEAQQELVEDSLLTLKSDMGGAVQWLTLCERSLKPSTIVVSEVEARMEVLETEIANAKALMDLCAELRASVTFSMEEKAIVDFTAGGEAGNIFDDDLFVVETADSALKSIVQKLMYKPRRSDLNEIQVLSEGRGELVDKCKKVLVMVQASLMDRIGVLASNPPGTFQSSVTVQGGGRTELHFKAFSLLCARLRSADADGAAQVVNAYASRARTARASELSPVRQVGMTEQSFYTALDLVLDRLNSLCRSRSQACHLLFDATADTAGRDRDAFVDDILDMELAGIPLVLDNFARARFEWEGGAAYLLCMLSVGRRLVEVTVEGAGPSSASDPGKSSPQIMWEHLIEFSYRCRKMLTEHVNDLIAATSSRAASAAAVLLTSPETEEKSAGALSRAQQRTQSPSAVTTNLYLLAENNSSMLKTAAKLLAIAGERQDNGKDDIRFCNEQVVDIVRSVATNVDTVASDDGNRSLIIRLEHFSEVGEALRGVEMSAVVAELVEHSKQSAERCLARYVDRVLRRVMANYEVYSSNQGQSAAKVSEAIAETVEELGQGLELYMTPQARRRLHDVAMKRLWVLLVRAKIR